MNDLDICKRIAEIDGVKTFIYGHVAFGKVLCREMVVGGLAPQPYNPLTDDALNLKLRDKYEVCVDYIYMCTTVWEEDDQGNHHRLSQVFFRNKESVNKSSCLAIIEAHKDNNNE